MPLGTSGHLTFEMKPSSGASQTKCEYSRDGECAERYQEMKPERSPGLRAETRGEYLAVFTNERHCQKARP
jgi:hypothetical protein